jgi:hypothetical protein
VPSAPLPRRQSVVVVITNYRALPVQRLCHQVVSVEVFHKVNDLERSHTVTVQAGSQFLLLFDPACQGALVIPSPDTVFKRGGAQLRSNGHLTAGFYVSPRPQVVHFAIAPLGGAPYEATVEVVPIGQPAVGP